MNKIIRCCLAMHMQELHHVQYLELIYMKDSYQLLQYQSIHTTRVSKKYYLGVCILSSQYACMVYELLYCRKLNKKFMYYAQSLYKLEYNRLVCCNLSYLVYYLMFMSIHHVCIIIKSYSTCVWICIQCREYSTTRSMDNIIHTRTPRVLEYNCARHTSQYVLSTNQYINRILSSFFDCLNHVHAKTMLYFILIFNSHY